MTFSGYVALMALGACASWIAWFVVLASVDPSRAGALAFLLFYAALSAALVGTLSVVGAVMRAWAYPDELPSRHVTRAFRQSLLLALLLVGSLMLLAKGLFTWWMMVLLVLALALLELVFQTADRPRRGGREDLSA